MFGFIRKLAATVTPVVLGIALWQFGGIQELAMKQFRLATSWASSDGTADLKRFELQLERNLKSLQLARTKLQTQQKDVASKEADRLEEVARLDHLLACFRAASLTGLSEGFPQKVFTRAYSEEQIHTTVQELLNRRNEVQPAGKAPVHELSQAVARMEQRISETRRHLENMPVYEALAIAGDAAGRSGTIMESLTACLQANQSLLASPGTTTTDAVVNVTPASVDSAEGMDSGFANGLDAAEFLKPTDLELQTPKTEASPPTVSELQNALKNIALQSR